MKNTCYTYYRSGTHVHAYAHAVIHDRYSRDDNLVGLEAAGLPSLTCWTLPVTLEVHLYPRKHGSDAFPSCARHVHIPRDVRQTLRSLLQQMFINRGVWEPVYKQYSATCGHMINSGVCCGVSEYHLSLA